MRFTFVLILIFLGLVTAAEDDGREILLRQKFIYEILLHVENPLEFEEWIQHGKTLNFDHTLYKIYDRWMEQFYESYQKGALLLKGEFFGELVRSHMEQAKGLFHFFYYAKDWKTFQQNVCWARINVNEGMFVYALNLAVLHREWPLETPAIYEIFPQHFFNSKFIYQGVKFNYDSWQKWFVYDQEVKNLNNTQQLDNWQWWKWMGLEQRWYSAERTVGDSYRITRWFPDYTNIMKGNEKFFMPVGYTNDIKIWNKHSKLSYFTEDVAWSDSWYRLNLETSVLLPTEHSSDRSLIWLQAVQKYWARYNLERLSNGIDEIEDMARNSKLRTGYNPQMISWNGMTFLQRANNFYYNEISQNKIMGKAEAIRLNLLSTFQTNNVHNSSGGSIDMKSSAGYKHFAQLLHDDIEDYSESYFVIAMMFQGNLNYDEFHDIYPHVLLNFETMLRDPLAYVIFKSKFLDYLRQYQQTLAPYTREQLLVEGVQIVDAQFSELVTKFEYADFDVSNLLNEKMHFAEGQYQWRHTLLARQMRLANTLFEYNITVDSAVQQKVLVRIFVGPKYDDYGRVPALNENRFNFMELETFSWKLQKGNNFATRLYGYIEDLKELTYTEKYHTLLYSLEHDLTEGLEKQLRKHRWTLPKGTLQGFPVQMFFIIQNANAERGTFPFDREIDESEFFVPNVFFKDVKIYHEDILEKYSKGYKNYGHFDYERA